MDLAVPDVVTSFAATVRQLLDDRGGTALCRRAEADPSLRTDLGLALEALGLWDLDVRGDLTQALAAAESIRVGGAVALPYPVPARLLARGSAWLCVARTASDPVHVDHGDLAPEWVVAGLDGGAGRVTGFERPSGGLLAPFVGPGTVTGPAEDVAVRDVALALTFGAFWLLGAAERALTLTIDHLLVRQQFGRPLAHFQGPRLRIAECVTGLKGLRELGVHTLWRHFECAEDALIDALALRSVALEAVPAVFSAAHQLHGAGGFAMEHDVTLLHRHAQAYLRLPVGYDETGQLMLREIEATGFDSLFGRFSAGPGGGPG